MIEGFETFPRRESERARSDEKASLERARLSLFERALRKRRWERDPIPRAPLRAREESAEVGRATTRSFSRAKRSVGGGTEGWESIRNRRMELPSRSSCAARIPSAKPARFEAVFPFGERGKRFETRRKTIERAVGASKRAVQERRPSRESGSFRHLRCAKREKEKDDVGTRARACSLVLPTCSADPSISLEREPVPFSTSFVPFFDRVRFPSKSRTKRRDGKEGFGLATLEQGRDSVATSGSTRRGIVGAGGRATRRILRARRKRPRICESEERERSWRRSG